MLESNPAINRANHVPGTITYNGIINRTGYLMVFTIIATTLCNIGFKTGQLPVGAGIAGTLIAFVLGLWLVFVPTAANIVTTSVYAALQGLSLGAITQLAELKYPGIATQALALTFGCFGAAFLAYRSGIIKASPGFAKFILIALLAIVGLYLVDIVAGLFGSPIQLLHDSSPASIGISAAIVLIATLTFILDFDEAEKAVGRGASSSYAWYLAFGLLVGLIWLYIEVLRLLMKLRSK